MNNDNLLKFGAQTFELISMNFEFWIRVRNHSETLRRTKKSVKDLGNRNSCLNQICSRGNPVEEELQTASCAPFKRSEETGSSLDLPLNLVSDAVSN